MKKVVVTGATSSIGIAILTECISNNVEVLAIIRKNSKNRSRIPNSNLIEVVEHDLNELVEFPVDLYVDKKYEVFYHLAWENTEKAYRNNPVFQNANIGYTLDAVKLANRLGCQTFIGAGSQAEYGRVENKISPHTLVNPDTAYGVAKYAAYKLSSLYCKDLGMRHIWGRIFSVYGLYDNKDTMIMYAINQMLNGGRTSFTKCEQKWDYLFSKDAGYAFYLMGRKGIDQKVYCVGSGNALPLFEYINIIHNQIDPELHVGIGELDYALHQVMYLCADISELSYDTGFQPRYTFDEGITETIQWIKGVSE